MTQSNKLRPNGSTRLAEPGRGERGKFKRKFSEIFVLPDYACVHLGHGAFSKISLSDIPFAAGVAWHWDADGYAKNSKLGRLQNVILQPPLNYVVDHINGDRLDNRRSNLRIVSLSTNSRNVNFGKISGRSGIRGVAWNSMRGQWSVRPRVNGSRVFLGYFDNKEDAAKVYKNFIQMIEVTTK